jgi:hypothetical protein
LTCEGNYDACGETANRVAQPSAAIRRMTSLQLSPSAPAVLHPGREPSLIFDRRPKRLRDNLRQICRVDPLQALGLELGEMAGAVVCECTPTTPRQCFRSPRINSANARFGLLGRLASRVVGLDLAERRDALRGFHAERAPIFHRPQRTMALTIVKAQKNRKEEFFTRRARPAPHPASRRHQGPRTCERRKNFSQPSRGFADLVARA